MHIGGFAASCKYEPSPQPSQGLLLPALEKVPRLHAVHPEVPATLVPVYPAAQTLQAEASSPKVFELELVPLVVVYPVVQAVHATLLSVAL